MKVETAKRRAVDAEVVHVQVPAADLAEVTKDGRVLQPDRAGVDARVRAVEIAPVGFRNAGPLQT
jgi:hypothetical protein